MQRQLQLACNPSVVEVNESIFLSVKFHKDELNVVMVFDFLIVPVLSNDLNLGLPFFLNRHFFSISLEKVTLAVESSCSMSLPNKTKIIDGIHTLSIPVTYVNTNVYLSWCAVDPLPSIGNSDHPKNQPCLETNGNGNNETCDAKLSQSSPIDLQSHCGFEIRAKEMNSDEGEGKVNSVLRRNEIDKDEMASVAEEFGSRGAFFIPIEKIADSTPLEYFKNSPKRDFSSFS